MVRALSPYGLLLFVCLSGCSRWNAPTPGGRLVAEYAPGKDASTSWTPYKATYVLRHAPEPPTDPPPREWIPERETTDVFIRGLGKWQNVGFEKTSDGQLLAVAGEEKIKLEPGRYRWHIDPQTEYTGFQWLAQESGERAVQIISLPFGLAAAAIVLPIVVIGLAIALPFMIFA